MVDIDEVMRQFDRLDGKIEILINQYKSLVIANSQLQNKVNELESALSKKIEAENQHSEQKAMIRTKINSLLARIEGIPEIRVTE